MARESCNLDKEEAEILKPSSSPSSTSPAPPPPVAASPPPLFLKPPPELPTHGPERPEVPTADPGCGAASCDQAKALEGDEEREDRTPVRFTNQCSRCRRRVGLTGFRCRCGDLFCARHRYSDTHDCSFDYKAAGREEISKANPVIRAAKIIKI
uniref:Zinc finger AN1 domain-containing stress-associated protein 15 n=1 Tax=Anthurium amnicola TaxID=1678845 RepID=A0A1D1Z2R8_9ARAE